MNGLASPNGRPEPGSNFSAVLDALVDPDSARWQAREAAAEEVGRMEISIEDRDLAAEALVQALGNDARETVARAHRRSSPLAGGVACVLGVFLLAWLNRAGILGWSSPSDLALCALVLGVPLAIACFDLILVGAVWPIAHTLYRRRHARLRTAAAKALGSMQCVDAIAPLAAGLASRDRPPYQEACASSLVSLVPYLDARHYGEMPPNVVPAMCHLLGRGKVAHDIALLRALAKVGGGGAIGPVERLARTTRSDEVAAIAEQVLPVLRERQRIEQDAGRLVRPAVSPSDGAGVLVRPAPTGASADARNLLRPTAGPTPPNPE